MTIAEVAKLRDNIKRGIYVPTPTLLALCDLTLTLYADFKRVQQENQRLSSPPLL